MTKYIKENLPSLYNRVYNWCIENNCIDMFNEYLLEFYYSVID